MSLFLQIMISTWIISTICVIIGYTSALSNRDFAGLINAINKSETLNLFEAVTDLRDYWLSLNKNTEETLDGFIFSLFSMIDGESGSNDFHHLIIKDEGTILNNDNYLHELWVGYCEEENKK